MRDKWTVTHDFAFVFGGAELVTQQICSTFDEADLLTIAGEPDVISQMSGSSKAIVSRLVNDKNYRYLLPAYPLLLPKRGPIEGSVIASSYAFAHHLRCTGSKVVYCHSPLRQIWSASDELRSAADWKQRFAVQLLARPMRRLDRSAAVRADLYIATSTAVRGRIERYYGYKNVEIVPPPLNLPSGSFPAKGRSERAGLLWVGRVIEPYKKLGLLVSAMRDLPDHTLTVVGDGRDMELIRSEAPSNVCFKGWVSREELASLYGSHELLAFPSEDDFGITPIEAQSEGTPVVAYRGGGAVDTVSEDFSGVFFDEHSTASLVDAIRRASAMSWDYSAIQSAARDSYSTERFRNRLSDIVEAIDPRASTSSTRRSS